MSVRVTADIKQMKMTCRKAAIELPVYRATESCCRPERDLTHSNDNLNLSTTSQKHPKAF